MHPTPGQVYDHYANASKLDECIAWSKSTAKVGTVSLAHDVAKADACWNAANLHGVYPDIHCWRLTPESFQLILHDLTRLGLLNLTTLFEHTTRGCEFYVTLGNAEESAPRQVLPRVNALLAQRF